MDKGLDCLLGDILQTKVLNNYFKEGVKMSIGYTKDWTEYDPEDEVQRLRYKTERKEARMDERYEQERDDI